MIKVFYGNTNQILYNSDIEKELLQRVNNPIRSELSTITDQTFRRTKLLSHLLMRILINDTYLISNKNMQYCKDKYGKPYLFSLPDVYLSSSISKNVIISAVSSESIGVDCELIVEKRPDDFKHFLTHDEYLSCQSSIDFLKIWTKKEAYSKLVGLGLNIPFSSFSVLDPSLNVLYNTFELNNTIISIASHNLSVYDCQPKDCSSTMIEQCLALAPII